MSLLSSVASNICRVRALSQHVAKYSTKSGRKNFVTSIASGRSPLIFESIISKNYAVNSTAQYQPQRTIYEAADLRMDRFDAFKARRLELLGDFSASYIARMKEHVQKEDYSYILHDDLLNLIALSNDEESLDMLEEIIKARVERDDIESLNHTSLVIRLCYHLDKADRAYNFMVRYGSAAFNTHQCYRIAMSLLYKHQMYDKVLDLYHKCSKELQFEVPIEQTSFGLIAAAACAKLNTAESLKQAQELLAKSSKINVKQGMLFAYLAIQQKQFNLALDTISKLHPRPVPCVSMQIIAYGELGRFEDIVMKLNNQLKLDSFRKIITMDGLEYLQNKVTTLEDPVMAEQITQLLPALHERSLEITFEESLFRVPRRFSEPSTGSEQQDDTGSHNPQDTNIDNKYASKRSFKNQDREDTRRRQYNNNNNPWESFPDNRNYGRGRQQQRASQGGGRYAARSNSHNAHEDRDLD